jgi:hypothetical protein
MTRVKRFSAFAALAGYMLATVAIHALHDHSHAAAGCVEPAHCASHHAAHGDESPDHDDCPAGDCEESCSACRLLAVKSIAAVVVVVDESVTAVCRVETPPAPEAPVIRLALPPSRGPPSV